jgi:hypothetical protein
MIPLEACVYRIIVALWQNTDPDIPILIVGQA